MSTNVVPFQAHQLPALFQGIAMEDASLSENVGAGFAVVSIKGKVFRIKHGGTEVPLMINHQGQQFPAPYFDVIMPKANPALSKTYYKDQYAEGSSESPDCWSEDGIHPLAVPPVAPDCRMCPMNQLGSKVSESGAKLKACADSRKVAVVPADNIVNERFGGAMLLRVPPASLGTLADYDRMLKSNGVPFYAVVTRISFDSTVAYPKLVFTPLRVLNDTEAQQIVALRKDLRVDAVINAPQTTSPQAPGSQLGAAISSDVAAAAPQPTFQQPAPAQAPVPTFAAPAPAQAPLPPFNPGTGEISAQAPTFAPPAAAPAAAPPPMFAPPAAAPAVFTPPAAPAQGEFIPAPPPAFTPPMAPPPTQAAPAAAPAAAPMTPGFLQNLESLLKT